MTKWPSLKSGITSEPKRRVVEIVEEVGHLQRVVEFDGPRENLEAVEDEARAELEDGDHSVLGNVRGVALLASDAVPQQLRDVGVVELLCQKNFFHQLEGGVGVAF